MSDLTLKKNLKDFMPPLSTLFRKAAIHYYMLLEKGYTKSILKNAGKEESQDETYSHAWNRWHYRL